MQPAFKSIGVHWGSTHNIQIMNRTFPAHDGLVHWAFSQTHLEESCPSFPLLYEIMWLCLLHIAQDATILLAPTTAPDHRVRVCQLNDTQRSIAECSGHGDKLS